MQRNAVQSQKGRQKGRDQWKGLASGVDHLLVHSWVPCAEDAEKALGMQKKCAKAVSDAGRVIAKLAPLIHRLRLAQGDPDFGKVAKYVQADLKNGSTIVAALDKEAKDVSQTKEPLSFSLGRLEEIHKNALSTLKLALSPVQ